jgi:hypothetical protein
MADRGTAHEREQVRRTMRRGRSKVVGEIARALSRRQSDALELPRHRSGGTPSALLRTPQLIPLFEVRRDWQPVELLDVAQQIETQIEERLALRGRLDNFSRRAADKIRSPAQATSWARR